VNYFILGIIIAHLSKSGDNQTDMNISLRAVVNKTQEILKKLINFCKSNEMEPRSTSCLNPFVT